MKYAIVLCSLFWGWTSDAASPSAASLHELFTAMEAERLLESAYQQLNASLHNQVAQLDIQPSQKPIVQAFSQKYTQLVRNELSWVKLEPAMAKAYANAFSEEDIKAMTVFYRTPTGQKMLQKMPQLLQQSASIVQQAMQNLEPQLNQLQQELTQALKQPATQ